MSVYRSDSLSQSPTPSLSPEPSTGQSNRLQSNILLRKEMDVQRRGAPSLNRQQPLPSSMMAQAVPINSKAIPMTFQTYNRIGAPLASTPVRPTVAVMPFPDMPAMPPPLQRTPKKGPQRLSTPELDPPMESPPSESIRENEDRDSDLVTLESLPEMLTVPVETPENPVPRMRMSTPELIDSDDEDEEDEVDEKEMHRGLSSELISLFRTSLQKPRHLPTEEQLLKLGFMSDDDSEKPRKVLFRNSLARMALNEDDNLVVRKHPNRRILPQRDWRNSILALVHWMKNKNYKMTIASVTARYCEHFAMGKRDFGAPKEFIQSVVMGARNKTSYFVDPSFVFSGGSKPSSPTNTPTPIPSSPPTPQEPVSEKTQTDFPPAVDISKANMASSYQCANFITTNPLMNPIVLAKAIAQRALVQAARVAPVEEARAIAFAALEETLNERNVSSIIQSIIFNQFNQTNPPPTVNLQKQAEIAQGPPLSAPKTPISTLPTNARTPNTTLAQNPLAAISNVAASSSSMSSFHLSDKSPSTNSPSYFRPLPISKVSFQSPKEGKRRRT